MEQAGKTLPDFFIVGHPKCGTTALYEMLRRHPQIFLPELNETHFFAREPGESARTFKRDYPETLEQYLALFDAASAGQRVGENSTSYLRSSAAADRIARLRPDAHIIAILREPAEFVRSFHLQLLQSGVETEPDLARSLELEEQRRGTPTGGRSPMWQQALLYSDHVRYARQLREYHERFGRDRVLVLIYEDFRADNAAAVREILRFLQVDDTVPVPSIEANPTLRVRSRRGERLVNAVAVGRGPVSRVLKRAVTTVTPQRVRHRAHRTAVRMVIDTKPRPPSQQLIDELRRRFEPEVIAASEYLERDLVSLWGYDRNR